MGELFRQTVERGAAIVARGYRYVQMWECEWSTQKKADAALRSRVDQYRLATPLQPRHALFGGRTNGLKLHHAVRKGEEVIRYYDIKSLYPFVNARREYPVGHPDILLDISEPLHDVHTRFRGLFKCTVLPPRNLYIPVLPVRTSEKKLVFPLCAVCAEERNADPCGHTDDQRTLAGTWTHVELVKAVELGYVVCSVVEVWHWPRWSMNLFSSYINSFYAIKEQASGWPEWVKTAEDRDLHIRQVQARDGILLDRNKIAKNPGLRQTAKLMLNSFWGKFHSFFFPDYPFHVFFFCECVCVCVMRPSSSFVWCREVRSTLQHAPSRVLFGRRAFLLHTGQGRRRRQTNKQHRGGDGTGGVQYGRRPRQRLGQRERGHRGVHDSVRPSRAVQTSRASPAPRPLL